MEHSEYRTRERLRSWRRLGAGAAGLAALDQGVTPLLGLADGGTDNDPNRFFGLAVEPVLDWVPGVLGSDFPLSGAVIAAGVAASGYAAWQLHRRNTDEWEHRARRHARGWATARDLWRNSGAAAARRSGRQTRPSFSAWACARRPLTEFGMVLGDVITGPRSARGRAMVAGWERGVLVIGEPGTFKSTLLAGGVLDFPGPLMVVSTKNEFITGTADVRRATGPVKVFDPLSPTATANEDQFRFDYVAGCRDAATAQRRAAAIMAASSGQGLNNAEFWQGRARTLMTALLCAADLGGHTLRDVATWLQRENYERPIKILNHFEAELEPFIVNALAQMKSSSASAASGSAAQTGSQVLEFLADARVAALLAPERGEGTDVEQFVRDNGTLYLVSGSNPALGPVMSALAAHVTWTAKTLAVTERLDPPLGFIVDEAHLTMPSVPLHEMAAELRGWGVWMAVAVQNYAQLVEKWGAEAARTMRASLQILVVTGAHDQEDREMYSERVGERREHHVTETTNAPDDTRRRWFGNFFGEGRTASTGTQRVEVPIMRPEEFSALAAREALVIPNKGAAAIVKFPNHWARAAAMRERMEAERVVGATTFDRIKARRGYRTAAAEEGEQA
ncbi:TraM recognition domain-containing protein [Saccharopolyspora sp. NPDC000359]|uniref:type IV secretory system conjugative DNA transfer family protein n=1 Tax=Saccharopolyspora sp. NPDC000359 TaxID=3154251 RepID=UPI003330AD1B